MKHSIKQIKQLLFGNDEIFLRRIKKNFKQRLNYKPVLDKTKEQKNYRKPFCK